MSTVKGNYVPGRIQIAKRPAIGAWVILLPILTMIEIRKKCREYPVVVHWEAVAMSGNREKRIQPRPKEVLWCTV